STEAKRSAECPDPCVSKGHAQKIKNIPQNLNKNSLPFHLQLNIKQTLQNTSKKRYFLKYYLPKRNICTALKKSARPPMGR
ncbi:MAG: hypothetical protein NZ519_12220, partial [Bacteroidia bacterium]|nr:hypothetical protein [Bacteroidia bacterium]